MKELLYRRRCMFHKRYVTKNDFLLAKSVASSLGSTLSYYNNVLISGSATTGSYTISTPLNYKTLSQPITSIFDAVDSEFK